MTTQTDDLMVDSNENDDIFSSELDELLIRAELLSSLWC